MVGEENKDITMNSFKKRYNHECKVQTEYASQAQKQLHYLIPKVNITVDACSHNIEPRDAHSFEPSQPAMEGPYERRTLATTGTKYSEHGAALFQSNHVRKLQTPNHTTDSD
jgi:hypothetical protein